MLTLIDPHAPELIPCWRYSYGFYLGLAFQIADDVLSRCIFADEAGSKGRSCFFVCQVLDFVGSGEELGKPTGQDLREGSLLSHVLLLLKGSPRGVRKPHGAGDPLPPRQ